MHPDFPLSAHAVQNELRQRVRDALDELSEIDREILTMKYLEQMTLTEIAASLDISKTAAKARHVRALNRFSLKIGQDEGDQ